MTIRAVIVDDEKPARDRIRRFLGEHPDFEVVGEAGDGVSAVRTIEAARPDVVFLDVQMPEANGFDVLERLAVRPRIVFTTAYDRYAVQAFEAHALDYLLKPFDKKRFAAALARVREEVHRSVPAEEKLDALLQEIRESTEALRQAARPDAGPGREAPPSPTPPAPAPSGRPSPQHPGRPGSSLPASSSPLHSAGLATPDTQRSTGAGDRQDSRSAANGRQTQQEGEDPDGAGHDAGTAGAPSRGLAPGDRIPGKRGPRIYLLAPPEILWFEAEGELVFARAAAHRYLVSRTLTELEAALDPKMFFRSHRSFIVNLSAIGEIIPEESGNYRIIMRDSDRTAVPLSRRQARKLRDVFPW
jgi:DNA-binding LytR/AlgR family response regulator